MNLAHLLDGHDPAGIAVISRNRATTYGELTDQVARLRGGLVAAGIAPGERVAILCGNNRYFVVAYLAALGAGAVAVPLNPTSPGPELARELGVVTPAAVVLDPTAVAAWRQLPAGAVAGVRLTVVAEGDRPDGSVALDELLAAEPTPIVEVEPDTTAVMMFTSGTAGPPRAAMLTHANLAANLDQMDTADDRLLPGDVVYGVLPLFHIFGLNVVLAGSLRAGATVLLVQRFDPATAIESIVQRGVTVVPGAPPMWVAFSAFDDLPADTFKTVRLALSGAARLPQSAAERMQSRFGVTVYEGYGLTEASPVVTSSAGAARPGSVGRVLDGQEVRLVDPDGDAVLVGDAGEVWVRGANVFAGYFDDAEATARVLTDDGWLRTGDLATVDDDGYLYLVDRAKDLIIVSGFNVFPAEVEEVLGAHPAVAEVGVIGVAHPHDGEAVKAFVVLADGARTDEESLIDYAHDYLARYKCPSKVMFVDQLPRNAAGKLVRRELTGTVLQ
ncbi:MAG TPA: AMP-binding protein [Ilumatobacter sp.]|nr:AMP-binding protein [Ilumatobacter sp.]